MRKKRRGKVKAQEFEQQKKTYMDYPIVMEYKYLGIVFDEALKFDKHLDRIKT